MGDKGNELFRAGDNEAAEELFTNALALWPTDMYTNAFYGELLYRHRKDQLPKAIQLFKNALKGAGSFMDALYYLGTLARSLARLFLIPFHGSLFLMGWCECIAHLGMGMGMSMGMDMACGLSS
jgi:tetratricopeptide (TPR) repeat protein